VLHSQKLQHNFVSICRQLVKTYGKRKLMQMNPTMPLFEVLSASN
jgi:hypothetical protein